MLSQLLVAFTVELDNEFELQMIKAGYEGERLSLVVWTNMMRFIPQTGISVRNLGVNTLMNAESIKGELGCLERWGFVFLCPTSTNLLEIGKSLAHRPRRDGWGSGRGINNDFIVVLTTKGRKAAGIWPPLFGMVEERWRTRFGTDEINGLKTCLKAVVAQIKMELPDGLPPNWLPGGAPEYTERVALELAPDYNLPALLSKLLLLFALEFEQESKLPLSLCANTIRVLAENPVRVVDIPRLTGCSPETSGPGWQLKPFVIIETNPETGRGQIISLSEKGIAMQKKTKLIVHDIETRWQTKLGTENIQRLRTALQEMLQLRQGNHPAVREGLVPPPGTVRSGTAAPALGRRKVAPAAKTRAKELVAQTQDFLEDPTNNLPWYPLWDMNRGFGV